MCTVVHITDNRSCYALMTYETLLALLAPLGVLAALVSYATAKSVLRGVQSTISAIEYELDELHERQTRAARREAVRRSRSKAEADDDDQAPLAFGEADPTLKAKLRRVWASRRAA